MGQKKRTGQGILFFLALLLLVVPAWGAEYDYREGMDSFFAEEGEELLDKLPGEAQGLLDRLGLEGISGTVEGLTPQLFFQAVWESILEQLRSPSAFWSPWWGYCSFAPFWRALAHPFPPGGRTPSWG